MTSVTSLLVVLPEDDREIEKALEQTRTVTPTVSGSTSTPQTHAVGVANAQSKSMTMFFQ